MDPVIPVSLTYVGGMIAAEILNNEDYLMEKLNDQYFKIKECL